MSIKRIDVACVNIILLPRLRYDVSIVQRICYLFTLLTTLTVGLNRPERELSSENLLISQFVVFW